MTAATDMISRVPEKLIGAIGRIGPERSRIIFSAAGAGERFSRDRL